MLCVCNNQLCKILICGLSDGFDCLVFFRNLHCLLCVKYCSRGRKAESVTMIPNDPLLPYLDMQRQFCSYSNGMDSSRRAFFKFRNRNSHCQQCTAVCCHLNHDNLTYPFGFAFVSILVVDLIVIPALLTRNWNPSFISC